MGVGLGVWGSLGVCVVEMTGCNGGQECGKVMKAVAKANKLGMKKCVWRRMLCGVAWQHLT